MSRTSKYLVNLQKSTSPCCGVKIPFGLLWCQFAQQGWFRCRGVQHRVCSQQHHRIGQQTQASGPPQTVQKHLPQPQLVFLIRLRRFDPTVNSRSSSAAL